MKGCRRFYFCVLLLVRIMIITCTTCTMRLQVDDEKVPARAFTLRCPKCQNIVHAEPPVSTHREDALNVGHSPASSHPRFESPAPQYKLETPSSQDERLPTNEEYSNAEGKELLRMLSGVLKRGTRATDAQRGDLKWETRRVLICAGKQQREIVARNLAEMDCKVYVAQNKAQAVERMREERMDVIILSRDFDPAEQGAAFINRDVNALRPSDRRRLFLVHLTETGRTLDAHAAFVRNVNLLVNRGDLDQMAPALDRALRDYNDLHRSYNDALGVSPI